MNDRVRTKQQLIAELQQLRQRVAELEAEKAPLTIQQLAVTGEAELLAGNSLQERFYDELLAQAVKTTNASIGYFDVTASIFVASPQALAIHGLTPETALTHAAAVAVIHPEDLPHVEEAWHACIEQGTFSLVEYRIVQQDGTSRWIAAQGQCLPGLHGDRLCIMAQDITERKRAEEELRQSEARAHQHLAELEAIYRSTPIGLCVLDRDLRYVRINDYLAELNGIPAAEHIDRSVRELFPDFADQAEALLQQILETGKPVLNVELTGTTPSHPGVLRTCIEQWLPLKDAQGSIRGINVVIEDITERKRAEEALRQSEERLQLALAAAEAGMWMWDLQDSWHTTPQINILFGRPAEGPPMRHEEFSSMVYPEDVERIMKAWNRTVHSGVPYHQEYRIVMPDRSLRWLTSIGRVVKFPSGTQQFLGVSFDITERKRMEEELQSLNETLERRVAQRTAALKKSQEQFRRLSDELLQAHETERKRIANEIHDNAGQVLSAVKYRVEGALLKLRNEAPNLEREPLEQLVPLIQRCIEDMRRLQAELRPTMLDDMGLLSTIRWFCRQFQITYPSIRVEPEITVEECEVPLRLKIVVFRVLQEAMNNAGKHSDAKLIRIMLRKRNGTLSLQIGDNGRGFNINDVQAARAFNKGLGLSSMRERVQYSGGRISIDSSSKNGTRIEAHWSKKALR
ncbi:MAG TPA: PAS domain S-box protein [Thermodesulfobacteriota bacterium]|nr:PAS domain S-box protein [Thermodesulfobacteriota bacterium]HNU72111.1 PAS domain S-box protein [Thermodesulfobacteriota bacterium]